ncbi:MAG TPA: hypothetical protein PK156_04390 [Polyangium sp.]|nr:hypothetical protein [Polyangium sp.]
MGRTISAWWGFLAGFVIVGCAPDLRVAGDGGAGGTGGTSASSSGMPSDEDCDDGLDNDGDNLTDCADTANCSDLFSCQPSPPSGWTYVHIRRIAFGDDEMPCIDGSAPQHLFEEPVNSDCHACMCQVTGKCENTLDCYLFASCAGTATTQTYTNEGECSMVGPVFSSNSCKVGALPTVPLGATCSASGGGLSKVNPFNKEVLVCPAAETATGCGESTCVKVHGAGYENKLCVAQEGTFACPAGFSELHSTFSSYVDMRACSSCACDESQIKCTGPTAFALFNSTQCTSASSQMVTSSNGCVNMATVPASMSVLTLPDQSIPKTACVGGVPSGSVMGDKPTTICCAKL